MNFEGSRGPTRTKAMILGEQKHKNLTRSIGIQLFGGIGEESDFTGNKRAGVPTP